ncbi:hypothetical protein PFDG_01675 [Plasmodium falciparum Dd2]|uniref:Uncharacterized protein n=1 Tax=Plasmodium falciparum (isolate Dd2) TaxID=57267 RepID=A0A0L7M0P3_PLAF4|nr:hypothetical protein PFDG_01675 [Plasmodium falciparum Dd2]
MFKRCILYFVISIFSLVLVVYKESRYGYNKFKYEKKYKKGCDINDDLCYNENDDNVDNAKAIGKTENDYEVVNYDEYTNNNKKKSISLSNNKTKNKNYFDNYNNKYVDKNEINYIFKPYFEELNNNITKLDHVISLFYEFSINAKFFILIFFKSTMNILHSYGILLISLIKILFLWFIIIQPYIKWLFIKLKKSYMKLDYQIFPYIISTLLYATIIKTIPIKCISFFIYSCFFPFPSIYSIVIILKYVYLPTLNTCIINKVEEKYHQKNQEKNQNQTKYQSVDTSTTSKEKHEYIRTQHHNSCTTNAGSCMQIQDVSETNEGLTLKKKYINGKDKDKEKDKEKEKKRETSKGMLKKITKKVTGKISKKTAQEGACENDVQEGACKNDVQEGSCENDVQEGACKNDVQEGACKNDVQEGACKNNVQEGEGHSQEINHHNIDQVDEIYDSSTEEECDHPVDYKDEKNEHLLNDQMDDGVEDYVEEYIEEQAKGENKICYKDINKNVHINHIHINDINQNNKKAMDEKNNYCISNFSFIKKKYSTLFGLESFNLRFRYKSKRENKSELSSSQYNQIGNERFSCASSVSFLNDEEGNILSYDVPILLEYWLFINILKFLKTAFFFHKFVKIPFLFEYFTLFVITINLSEKLHEFMFLKKYKSSILVRLLKNVLVTTVDFLLYFLFNVRLENEKREEEKQNNNNNNKKEYLERSNLLIKLSKIFKEKLKMNETVKFSFTCLKSIITENVVESVKLPLYIKICINILIYMPQLVLLIFPSFILKIYFLYIFFLAPIFGSLKCLEEKKEIHNKIYFICYFFFYNISSIVVNHSIFKCLPFYNLYKILITISVQTALKYIFNTLKLMS